MARAKIPKYSVHAKDDGVWLRFDLPDGGGACLNLAAIIQDRADGVIKGQLLKWSELFVKAQAMSSLRRAVARRRRFRLKK